MTLMIFTHRKVPGDLFKGKKVLDIGCGRNKIPGAVGLDQLELPGVDIVTNLNERLPIEDGQFEAVNANQVLEHVQNLVGLVYEVHRILKDDGIFLVHVPYFRSSWAHIDPTHVRSFTINTMDYFVKGTYCYQGYRFCDEAFRKIEIFLDTDYHSTLLRGIFSKIAIRYSFRFENSMLSSLYPFEQLTFLLTK